MKLVFCGTPEFAVPCLQALLDAGHEVPLVLTQPDRPAGRGMEFQAPPVKRLAVQHGIEVLQPEKIKTNQELRELLEAIAPDAIIVVAYGRLIPGWMLNLPRFGNLNVHASLLPKYRGAAPIQWAVAEGETETGVSIMRLDEGLDTGDVLLKRPLPIGPDTLASDLFPQLSQIGAEALLAVLDGLADGTIAAYPQEHSQATLAPILTREDGQILPASRTAQQIYNRFRGFYPWPGCHTTFRSKRFLIHKMHIFPQPLDAQPGSLILRDGELLLAAANNTAAVLDEVQLAGKPRLPGPQFARDFQLKSGESIA